MTSKQRKREKQRKTILNGNTRSFYKGSQLGNGTPVDYLLVLDFEATCDKDSPNWVNEIIEFPIILLRTQDYATIAEFHSFVKPTQNPTLTRFCVEFTGIEQHNVDSAPSLQEVLQQVREWMISQNLIDAEGTPLVPFSFATDGPWDFRDFLLPECERLGIECPFYMKKSIDLRALFPAFFECKRMGLHGMLNVLGLKFEGRQHSGIADARNIARIAVGLLERGCKMTAAV